MAWYGMVVHAGGKHAWWCMGGIVAWCVMAWWWHDGACWHGFIVAQLHGGIVVA